MTDRPALTWNERPMVPITDKNGNEENGIRPARAGDVVNCPDCDGLGYTETTPDQPDCPTCRGSGRVQLNSDVLVCQDCFGDNGAGRPAFDVPCESCNGQPYRARQREPAP